MSFDETAREAAGAAPSSTTSSSAEAAAQAASSNAAQPLGFCQDCGRALSGETARPVGSGLFCEPCLQRRLAGVPSAAPGEMPPVPGEPRPVLAGILGLIPGVGAMYNGQFAKGFAHIVIFAILVSLSDNVNGVFGLLVAGWVVYQGFDAYHTAQARRQGLPLPNLFGLNDIGERIGQHRGWTAAPRAAGQPVPPVSATPWTPPPADAGWAPVAPPAAGAAAPPPTSVPLPNWVGYVPPASFAEAPFVEPSASAQGAPGSWNAAYTPASVEPPAVPPPPSRSIPMGAVWLIGLGVLFLIANVLPFRHFPGHWLVPILFIVLSVTMFYRRLEILEQMRGSAPVNRMYLVTLLRPPLILATLALIFSLQALDVATLRQTWPLLLIVLGGLLLVERAGVVLPPPEATVTTSVVPPAPPAAPSSEEASR